MVDSLSRFRAGVIHGFLSLDRVTLLFFAPSLSLWGSDSNRNEEKVNRMKEILEKLLSDRLDPDLVQGKPSELFRFHYHTVDDIDIQFGTVMPRRTKINPAVVAMTIGLDSDTLPREYVYHPNDYSFRLEYNPNKSDLSSISNFLKFFKGHITSDQIKVSRLDIAIDYPVDLNPCLCFIDRFRKSFIAVGDSGVQTIYYGTRNSAYYVRIYDKAKELLEKKSVITPTPLWRFELEYKRSFALSSIPDLSNFFSRVKFHSPSQKFDDWKLNLFFSYASVHGFKSALALLPRTTRYRYTQLIQNTVTDLENPLDVYSRDFISCYNALRCNVMASLGYTILES